MAQEPLVFKLFPDPERDLSLQDLHVPRVALPKRKIFLDRQQLWSKQPPFSLFLFPSLSLYLYLLIPFGAKLRFSLPFSSILLHFFCSRLLPPRASWFSLQPFSNSSTLQQTTALGLGEDSVELVKE